MRLRAAPYGGDVATVRRRDLTACRQADGRHAHSTRCQDSAGQRSRPRPELASRLPTRPRGHLRRVEVNYIGFDGKTHRGDLIVHEELGSGGRRDLRATSSIALSGSRRSALVDSYPGAADELSMEDNNTRRSTVETFRGTGRWSPHAFGRAIQRVKRFTAFGTMEQSRGVARQLNEAIGAARALLKSSFTDSRSANPPPWARWPRRRVSREWSAARRRRMLPYTRPSPTRWPSGHVARRDLPARSPQMSTPP